MREPEITGILLISGTHERAHYAFVLAAAAAAIGRTVVLFATNAGCRALQQNWRGLQDAQRELELPARGVAGLQELREAAFELGIRAIACESGLRMEAIDAATLCPGVEIAGAVTFLEAVRGGTVVTC